MSKTTDQKPAPVQQVTWKQSDAPSVYANIMAFALSQFDISLFFGQIESGTPTELVAATQVRVQLSPEQAANLVKMLNVAIDGYTKANGALRTSGAVDVSALTALLEAKQVN